MAMVGSERQKVVPKMILATEGSMFGRCLPRTKRFAISAEQKNSIGTRGLLSCQEVDSTIQKHHTGFLDQIKN